MNTSWHATYSLAKLKTRLANLHSVNRLCSTSNFIQCVLKVLNKFYLIELSKSWSVCWIGHCTPAQVHRTKKVRDSYGKMNTDMFLHAANSMKRCWNQKSYQTDSILQSSVLRQIRVLMLPQIVRWSRCTKPQKQFVFEVAWIRLRAPWR